jgi:hypothetical protein
MLQVLTFVSTRSGLSIKLWWWRQNALKSVLRCWKWFETVMEMLPVSRAPNDWSIKSCSTGLQVIMYWTGLIYWRTYMYLSSLTTPFVPLTFSQGGALFSLSGAAITRCFSWLNAIAGDRRFLRAPPRVQGNSAEVRQSACRYVEALAGLNSLQQPIRICQRLCHDALHVAGDETSFEPCL